MTEYRPTAFARALGSAALIVVMAIATMVGTSTPCNKAFADDQMLSPISNINQAEIEVLESAYKSAQTRVAEAKARVAENQAKIDALMRKLPAQQERTDEAIRELYLMQDNRLRYVEMILGSDTLDEVFKKLDYFDRVSKTNLEELNKLKDMLAKLEEARVELDIAKADAEEQERIAHDALLIVQNERADKQRRGQSQALAQDNNAAIVDGADWYMTEDQFIAEWAPRIDAYFDGTPLAGTGTTFALMSFRYCVDPRWSPAISNTESSKGQFCIRPHNAWGWGAADSDPYNLASQWNSWDEAIEAHIRGLANGYGYTISKSAAEKYCSTPDSWYANTLSEMAKI